MEPWNNPAVLPPPNSTFLDSSKNDLRGLSHTCNNAIKVLMRQSPLHRESAVLSRFIYKFDKKFRNDIGYRNLKKVNTALRKYLTLNLLKDIENFASVMPSNDEDKYFPSRQMLEFIMIRIMTFSKIMKRINICSKQASIFYMNRIKRGESHWMSLMPYALLSRIWTMSSVLVQHSCAWFLNFHPYLNLLKHKGVDLLPVGYTLPANLEIWLDIKNLENYGKFEWSDKKSIKINLDLVEDDEMTFDNILDYVKEVNSEGSGKHQAPIDLVEQQIEPSQKLTATSVDQGVSTTMRCVDEGVSISREYFQSFFNKQTPKENHSADNVTNKVTLDAFISKEEEYRSKNNDLSLTKHLSFMQWQSLKSNLANLSNMLSKNRKIEKKFKKIWKEKCLDCL